MNGWKVMHACYWVELLNTSITRAISTLILILGQPLLESYTQ